MLTRLGRKDSSSAVHGLEGRKETGAVWLLCYTCTGSHLDKLHNCPHVNVYNIC